MDFSRFTTISLDCYGTLIDWESGMLPVLRTVLNNHGQILTDAEILELYGEFEAEAESGAYQSYREVLQSVVRKFSARLHFEASPAEIRSLPESVSSWQPFPDTVTSLNELQKRYKLVVISNIDDDLFAETQKDLGIQFDGVITAEQACSYKPSLNNFKMALRTFELSPNDLLHAGQSMYHDVLPAQSLGISTVWMNRKSARPGVGAVRASTGKPDLEFPDLASLVAAIRGT
jgi:2-haloacid dehalogenase